VHVIPKIAVIEGDGQGLARELYSVSSFSRYKTQDKQMTTSLHSADTFLPLVSSTFLVKRRHAVSPLGAILVPSRTRRPMPNASHQKSLNEYQTALQWMHEGKYDKARQVFEKFS
jgi:TolA-binding protein